MLSKIDLRDFLEINLVLYGEAASARQLALLQQLAHVLEQAASGCKSATGSDRDVTR